MSVTESDAYGDFIETLTKQLDRWRVSDEPSHEFARRIVGQMRVNEEAWRRKRGAAIPGVKKRVNARRR